MVKPIDPLVSTAWAADHLDDRGLAIVDATWLLGAPGEARRRFEAAHLPNAGFLDLDRLGAAIAAPEDAAAVLADAGIADGAAVLLYDDSPHRTAARAWWLLRLFGLTDVAILDGGLARWRAEGRTLATGVAKPAFAAPVTSGPGPSLRTKADVAAALDDGRAQIVDARSPARFAGVEPEPRPGIAPGHMPGARNMPYAGFFHDDGTWKREGTLRAAFEEAGVEVERPVIATCGSGVTAAVIAFGLHLLGRPDAGLYDGSWAEWGADPTTPKVLGA